MTTESVTSTTSLPENYNQSLKTERQTSTESLTTEKVTSTTESSTPSTTGIPTTTDTPFVSS